MRAISGQRQEAGQGKNAGQADPAENGGARGCGGHDATLAAFPRQGSPTDPNPRATNQEVPKDTKHSVEEENTDVGGA